ncbi:AMP-binding protein [Steroidobacter agaridevorans]|uniref:AMP-binding protein n=1 Tax=Steroidobacter agaridevorans TaxID=2695856 RepID=UPI00192A452E|nr:AMP-binding protein [Steroidobacter agaridevorans]
MPPRESVVLRYVLELRAASHPERIFASFPDGSQWTYRQTMTAAQQTACALARLGVRQGHRVLSWLPNGADALRAWFGANWLGATYVPINTAYRGGLLEHVIANSGAEVMICSAAFVSRLQGMKLSNLKTIIIADAAAVPATVPVDVCFGANVLTAPVDESLLSLPRPIEATDEQSIIYTSGTTGPSKGVLSSYCHLATSALVAFEERDAEGMRYLVTLPMFHAGGTIGIMGMLLLGRSIALPERFETDRFWNTIRATGSTCCTLLGAMATFLVKQPPSSGDREHTLRWAVVIPYTEDAKKFHQRFGVDMYCMFNMTEVSIPILSHANPEAVGACGVLRAGVHARLVDERDVDVPDGEVGELILRCDRPWSMNHGYNAAPEATAAAWRNGWFHTGDAFRRGSDGSFYFTDRIKDSIRRRGENISSLEVERECLAHPQVQEAAAIGVPSEFSEEDVMVVLAPVPGQSIDPAEFFEFLRPRMAHFMLPRYIRILDRLPRTPTEKVQKTELRAQGIAPQTWDRERHGISVKARA